MPKFPEIDPEITCERALNMILASIAMEELAVSHIVNAEGEKIQYVLGTLETSCGKRPDVDEILKVNQSVTCLMDSISQYQMILKNKMDKALHTLSEICPRPPAPPCPPDPPCPPEPCVPAGPEGPSCHCKCSAVFRAAEPCRPWCPGSALYWNAENLCGRCICSDPCDKTKIALRAQGRFVVNFSVNVKAVGCKRNAVIRLLMIKNHQRTYIYTVHSPVPHGGETVTISMHGIVIENFDYASSLLFKLESPDLLMVKDSMLSVIEI